MIFETLYSYPRGFRRHREGPLAVERAAFVEELAAQGLTCETQLRHGLAAASGGATLLDGRSDVALQGDQLLVGVGPEGLAGAAEDVGDLQSGAAHWPAAGSCVGTAGSRSNGLAAEQTFLTVMRR